MFDHLYDIINFFYEQLETNFILFFLLYLLSLIIFFSLSLPGGPVLIISSGFFFGFYVGFLINIIAILIGSFVFIYILKNIFNNLFNLFYLKFSKRLNNLIKHSSYEYLILIRLIAGIPLFIQNLFLSFINISKSKSSIKFIDPLPEGDMARRLPDIKKMRTLLLRDLIPLEEGISKLIDFKNAS